MTDALIRLPLTDVLDRFRSGTLDPRDYVEAFLSNVAEREEQVQAFEYIDAKAVRAAAAASAQRYRNAQPQGVLDGIPIGIKDIIETVDMPTAYGSPAFKGQHILQDARCVAALRRAGAIIFGKTVTTEFAYGVSGKTTNPHDVTRTPGGSSSGSAAAVAAGMVPVSLGTQTVGSVLRPASYNGVIGFKPGLGVISTQGIHPLSASLDHPGVFASDIDSLWLITRVMALGAGPAAGYRGLQGAEVTTLTSRKPQRLITLSLDGRTELSEEDAQTFDATLGRLEQHGTTILSSATHAEIAALERQLLAGVADIDAFIAYDMRYPYAGYVAQHGALIGERVQQSVLRSYDISAAAYDAMLDTRAHARAAVRQVLETLQADGFVLPAASGAAPHGLAFTGNRTWLKYASWLGFPAISLPLMTSESLPWGLQIMHHDGSEQRLLEIAKYLMGEPGSKT